MRLLSTKHSTFKGLKDDKHSFSDTNIILGDNGAGKTSLIEAIYTSLLGSSIGSFTKANKELSRNSHGPFMSESTVLNPQGLKVKRCFLSTKTNKKLMSNEEKITIREAFLSTPISLIDCNIEKIASESPKYRRRLIDRSVFHVEPKHAESYKRLEKALKQRNRSIRDGQAEGIISSWDGIIAEEGEAVTKHRNDFVEGLKEKVSQIQGRVSTKEITLEFFKGWSGGDLFEYLDKNIKRDMATKRTMGGPHRADIYIRLGGRPAKDYSSKGEEKQMSLSIAFAISKLIESKTGAIPLLMIDELESGLDEAALGRISEYIKSLKNQQLITALKHHKISKILKGKTIQPLQYNR